MGRASTGLAKFTPPDATGLVARPRLFRLVDRASRRAAVWVTGPPGSGKTSLVASYLRSRRVPAIWYRMDEGDSDPSSFGRALALAARRLHPGPWTPLPPPSPASRARVGASPRGFFRELYARLRRPAVLVLDDYQAAGEGADLNRVILAGLSEIPNRLTVIVISRHAPLPIFARLLASRQLAILEWDDLRLSRAEATAIARAHGGSRLPRAALSQLVARASGWAAGVTLLRDDWLTAAAANPSPQADPRAVRDYFDAEVFAHIEQRARTLLLTTAYLETVTPEAAVRLSGMRDAGAILSELAQRRLFVEEHTGAPNAAYRYHPMFRDLLIDRAEQALRPPALRRVQRAAAQELLAAGAVADAAALFGQTGDAPSLAELIRQQAGHLVREGHEQTVRAWLSRLPPRLLRTDPWLGYWSGVCRLSVDPTDSLAHFERAAEGFAAGGDRDGQWASAIGALRAILIESHAFRRMDPWIKVVDRLSQELDAVPPTQFADQAIPAILFALTLRRPDHPDIEQWVARAHGVLDESTHPTARLESGYALVTWYNWRGEPAQARTVVGSLRWRFSVVRNGSPMHFQKKSPHKPLRMLKAIIALGGRHIAEDQITDALWPEADGDRAHKAFSVTLTRLRRLLGIDHAMVVSHGRVSLDPARCWVDTWAFERLVSGAGQPAKTDSAGRGKDASDAGRVARLERAATLYQGPFLPDEGDGPWLTATRAREKAGYLRCLRALGQHWIERGEWATAAGWYEKGLEADELAEEWYQHLVACYVHLGRHAEARSVYQRCERLLAAHLGIQPSETTKALIPKG
ncbi:MAG: BTAD domain-containing putative transcriptional regulator [Nitrospirota bacterium]